MKRKINKNQINELNKSNWTLPNDRSGQTCKSSFADAGEIESGFPDASAFVGTRRLPAGILPALRYAVHANDRRNSGRFPLRRYFRCFRCFRCLRCCCCCCCCCLRRSFPAVLLGLGLGTATFFAVETTSPTRRSVTRFRRNSEVDGPAADFHAAHAADETRRRADVLQSSAPPDQVRRCRRE